MSPLPDIPTARDIMTKDLVTLRPRMPVGEAIKELLRHQISGAPVVGEDGRLLGLFSEYDCLKALANEEFHDEHDEECTVGDIMTHDGHTIAPDDGLFTIAQHFVTLRVRRLPVIDGDKLVGQVSRRDVLRALDALGTRLYDRKVYPDYPPDRKPIG